MRAVAAVLCLLLAACGAGLPGEPPGPRVAAGEGLLLDARHGDGLAWGRDDCAACHPLAAIHRDAPRIRPLVRAKGYAACTGCHGDNGSGAPRRCLLCHGGHGVAAPRLAGARAHAFGADGPLDDGACLRCHPAADMDGRFEPARDLGPVPGPDGLPAAPASVDAFCLGCHDPGPRRRDSGLDGLPADDPRLAIGPAWRHLDAHGLPAGSGARTYAGLRPPYRYPQVVPCSDCHAVHGSDNPALLADHGRQAAHRLPAALRDRPIPIRDGDFAPLCVLCHAMAVPVEAAAEDAGNGLAGVHRVGGDCRPCHRHGLAVQTGL